MLNLIINQNKPLPLPPGHSLTGNFYLNLLHCLEYPSEAPPLAALLAKYHQLEGDWVVVSPIHWQASHNDAMIMAHDEGLMLDSVTAKQWFQRFQTFVAPTHRRLFYHSETLWLLSLDETPPPIAKPVYQVIHGSLYPELEQLDPSYFWQRFITESQMFLSQEAALASELPINGVWLWGAGVLRAPVTFPIWCETIAMEQLANVIGKGQRIVEGSSVQKNGLFLLENEPSSLFTSHLNLNPLNWYWNNVSYTTKPPSFWERLRGLRWKLK